MPTAENKTMLWFARPVTSLFLMPSSPHPKLIVFPSSRWEDNEQSTQTNRKQIAGHCCLPSEKLDRTTPVGVTHGSSFSSLLQEFDAMVAKLKSRQQVCLNVPIS